MISARVFCFSPITNNNKHTKNESKVTCTHWTRQPAHYPFPEKGNVNHICILFSCHVFSMTSFFSSSLTVQRHCMFSSLHLHVFSVLLFQLFCHNILYQFCWYKNLDNFPLPFVSCFFFKSFSFATIFTLFAPYNMEASTFISKLQQIAEKRTRMDAFLMNRYCYFTCSHVLMCVRVEKNIKRVKTLIWNYSMVFASYEFSSFYWNSRDLLCGKERAKNMRVLSVLISFWRITFSHMTCTYE